MRILGISGSLRSESTNTRLLVAAMHLLPPGVGMHLTAHVARLPLFNPDLDPAGLGEVEDWIQEVRTADGIVVSTPEYARGYPGALKNAFDWLVNTDAHVDKPFMLLNASARSTVAQDTFTQVLETMSGVHIADATITVPLLGTQLDLPAIVGNLELAARIRQAMTTFVAELTKRASRGTGA